MNQIFLNNHWIINFIARSNDISVICILPLLGTWLGSFLISSEYSLNQTISLSELIYISTLIGIIPKTRISAITWFDTHFITLLCFILYYAEYYFLKHINLELEYSISWLFSLFFTTVITFFCYGILLRLNLSSRLYFKAIIKIYLLADAGSILALGMISPYLSYKLLTILSIVLIIYHLLPYGYIRLFANLEEFQSKFKENVAIIRCLFLGIMSVWVDFIALAPFYILEMIIASEDHRQLKAMFRYLRDMLPAYSKIAA
jgi:hypothetical protein